MQKGAKADAAKNNVKLTVASGKQEGDDQGQITAIEDAIARGDKGILITPMSTGVNAAIKKARDAGLFVIALDTPPDPASTVDITFATDNREAGKLDGQWAAAHAGRQGRHDRPARPVQRQDRLGRLQPRPGLPRGHGHPASTTRRRTVTRPRPASTPAARVATTRSSATRPVRAPRTAAAPRWRSASPRTRTSTSSTRSTSRRPSAPTRALKAAGKTATIVSVDGGCAGVASVKSGVIGATAQQYPLKMATLGMEAIAKIARGGEKPTTPPGLDFYNTGVALVTDKPVEGVKSITSDEGAKICWGN